MENTPDPVLAGRFLLAVLKFKEKRDEHTKEIQLTQDKVALVDADDFERINQFKWCYSSGYAVRSSGTRKEHETILMHREIIHVPDGMQTDHINLNGLDNRKENLRVCTHSQNMANAKPHRNNTSGFKGVTWNKKSKKWHAKIRVNGKTTYIDSFDNAEEAARAYDKAANKKFGEFAKTNFDQGDEHE